MKDIRQTKKFAQYLSRLGWEIEKIGNTQVFVRKLPLIGSVIKIQRPNRILGDKDIKILRDLERKYRVFQTIIEPASKKQEEKIRNHGFKLSKSPYLPSKTIHLDLTKTKKNLFNQLKKDAKYSLRKTSSLRICSIDKTKAFRDSWKKAVKTKRWVPSEKELNALLTTFENDSLFLVTPGGEAGAIFLQTKNRAYYWQAFASKKGRSMLAQYKIVWAAIHWAKKRGVKIFDFEGIYDERFPNKRWLGFTHFKKSFGGFEVEYPGAFVKTKLF